MQINLFGNLRIEVAGQPVTSVNTNRLQSLIAYLILHGDTPQPREKLAFTLWPASRESQARTNLRQLLHSLKRALPAGDNPLVIDHFSVHWRNHPSCTVDVAEFQAALAAAAEARTANDRMREMRCLNVAAQLYEDDLLPALYDDWLLPLREEFRRKICDALHRLTTLLEEQKKFASAIQFADRLLLLDGLNESYHQLLIRLHAANHDRASALRAYHQCMRILRREMGVEPGAATRELFGRILKGDGADPLERTPEPAGFAAGKALSHLQKVRTIVGRAAEWGKLAHVWQTAIEDGPRVAVISGEPGIGKTRLAEELYQSCLRQGHAAARGSCYAGRGQIAYAPVTEWLRSDVVRVTWANLRPQELAELARLIPEIGEQFPNVEVTRSEGPSALLENWQRRLLYESVNVAVAKTRKPLLLFLDDMQWCDLDSFEWLAAFLTTPAAAGVLLLGTVRAEETGHQHPFTRFLAGLRQSGLAVEIPLEPLNAQETTELALRESRQPLESAEVEELFRSTRGNPLFVLETLRAGSQSTRLHAVITARLAQLTASAYELAGLASVVGRPFSLELLAKATDWDERSVADALDELWQRRIIESRHAPEYDFSHDLLREVAYANLGVVRQRYLHRRVARALAEVHSAEIESWNGQIASHFEQAGMAEEAIVWFERAAAHARKRYADAEAAGLLKRALALCGGFPDSDRRLKQELKLLVALGPVLTTTEGYSAPEVGATYDRALDLSRRFEDRSIFVVLGGAWLFHIVRGQLQKARQLSQEFLGLAEQKPSPGLTLAGNFLHGSALFHLGELEGSLDHIDAALRADTGPSESIWAFFAGPDISVSCRAYLAHVTWHCGDDSRAVALAAEAINIAKRIHHPFSEAIAQAYAAMLHVFRGDNRLALEHGTEATELCSRYGFTYYLAMANVLTGWARGAEGDLSAGLAQLRDGLDGMRRLGAELRLPFYLQLFAETLGRAGQVGEASANLSNAFAFAGKNEEEWALAELHRAEGELLAREGKTVASQASFRRGLEAARRSGSVALQRKLSILPDGTPTTALTERL
ncbi:MAG TPA: AAA family ATPase [Bryobacteraceae bacterium]|jgi:predicted ATPase/DNA-binding SARP family transcriptional activator|nr:AAA family ATPase [Bryobacteraceae bacterium]